MGRPDVTSLVTQKYQGRSPARSPLSLFQLEQKVNVNQLIRDPNQWHS